MKPTTLLSVLLLCVAGPLCPQDKGSTTKPTGDQLLGVITRLKSHDLAQVAWGAHMAAEKGLKQVGPDLCRALRSLQGRGRQRGSLQKRNRRDVRPAAMALLDAMIRLEADVPSNDLKPWLSDFTLPATMVLMAPKPKRYEARFLEIFDRYKAEDRHSRYWCAAGNLLVSIRSKKIAARFLEGLSVSVSINVYDDDSNKDVRRNPEPWHGGAFDGPVLKVPGGYPPVPFYRVEKRKQTPESKLLAAGARSIYYRRIISPSYRIAATWMAEKPKRNLEWICDLLDVKIKNQPFQLWTTARHVWRDEASYLRKVDTEKQKVMGSFRSLINRLQGRGLVARERIAGLNPGVNVYVFDHRQKQMTPLPEIDGVQVEEVKATKATKATKKREKVPDENR